MACVSSVLYSGSLSIYYLLRIRNGWKEWQIVKYEPFMHLIPIVFGLSTMIAGLVLNLFNSGIFDCWIAPFPQGCQESWRGETTCIRGDNASIYQWAFDIVPKFSAIFLVTINMLLTYLAVRRQELSAQQYSASLAPRHLSQRMARQSYLYVGALWITYIPVAMTRMTQLIRGYTYYWMILTIAITIPLQGCWNVLVYLRPRYIHARDRQRRRSSQQQIQPAGMGSSTSRTIRYWRAAVSEAVREGQLGEDEEELDVVEESHPDRGNEKDENCDDKKKKATATASYSETLPSPPGSASDVLEPTEGRVNPTDQPSTGEE